ncbi:Polynucleotide 5'-hydroxyl-kinase GRC3 [Tolypocladium paradoxum]|uniref:Polynucleotide 5'-hydroxyl-kinase GRC3 n=1 Tax=Tolypocladium paradoxum TaxID=94208 RepID=A0A2S4KPA6_9HYPO|nr:Polynucleotide 5'-hydroxyl-kinase GRC3 [Tolypocladium paradoxum]
MLPSSNKRRKLDAPGTPQSAVSALSALAARRRLAASAGAEASASPTPEPEGTGASSPSNPFSPLQALSQKQVTAKSPKRAGARTPSGHGSSTGRGPPDEGPTTAADAAQSQAVAYSSFRLTKHNHRTKANGVVELRLDDSERFLVLGSFGIRILSGEVTVAGATLRPCQRTHWVHAAHCHAIPVLRTAEKTRLELHSDPAAESLRKLGRLSPLFRRIWNDPPGVVSEGRPKTPSTFSFLGTSEDAPKRCIIQELVSPPQWNKKLAALAESFPGRDPPATLICGPKSAGKSTFSKLLTNRLLTAGDTEPVGSIQAFTNGVVILDLDPGQPEYAPPGTLSLVHVTKPNLGASFTHPSLDDEAYKVVRCHSLASVNPASAAELHLECAMDLYDYYRRTLRSCPLLINTPGWILSLGLELLVQIIINIRPAEVIYMSEEGPAETVEALRNATKNTLATLPSQPAEFASRTAAHFREMQTMSYFHSLLGSSSEGTLRLSWSPSALSSLRPLVVRYSGQHSGIQGILRYDYQIPSDLLAEAINGMVLAIVEIEDPRAFRRLVRNVPSGSMGGDEVSGSASQPLISTSPEGIPFIPNPDDIALDPRHSRTIGLALIRGIDATTKSLQILTPMPVKKIVDAKSRGHGIVLVHGKFDAPTWSYTEHLYEQADQDDEPMAELEVTDEDTSEDGSVAEPDYASDAADGTAVPWVEVLGGNEKRPVGSRVWRVRRDLGRSTGD